MHPRLALPLLLLSAGLLGGAASAADLASVYDLRLEVDATRERVLIFCDAPVEPRLVPLDDRTVMIALPGASLGMSTPTRLTPVAQGSVVRVTAFDRADPLLDPEVRIVVQRRPGELPEVTRRDAVITVDFEPLSRPAAAREDTISISYRRTPMKRVVSELAEATGERLIFDDAVSGLGAITIEGPGRITRGEAAAMLDTILLLKGFAIVPSPGGARTVVPISGAQSPWAEEGELGSGDAPVTTLLHLDAANAPEVVSLLTPYLGAYSTAVAFEPTNSVILAGPASRLQRLRVAIRALDDIEAGVPVFWRLDNADAEVLAEHVSEILGERDAPLVIGDARTNTLLMRVRPEVLPRARALVERLDRPGRERGELHVIRLRNADPTTLAEQLLTLRDDAPASVEEDPAARRGGLRGLDFHVVAEPTTRSLLVRSAPEAYGPVFDTVRTLDVMPPSVRIEVTVATIGFDDRLELDVNAFIPTLTDPKQPDDLIASVTSRPGGGNPTTVDTSRPFTAAFTRAPLLLTILDPITGTPIVLPIPRESVSVTLDGRTVNSEILLRPQMLVVSGEEHEIFAGDNIPVPIASTGTVASGEGESGEGSTPVAQVRQNIERYDVGTSLRVTPTVGQEGSVSLQLAVLVSRLEPSQAGPVEEVGPSIREIDIESRVRLRHGELAVVATAIESTTQTLVTGVPWLKDIPWLGFLFRATSEQTMKQALLVTVEADILRPGSRELARRLAEMLGPLETSER